MAVERIDITVVGFVGNGFGVEIFLQSTPFEDVIAADEYAYPAQMRLPGPFGWQSISQRDILDTQVSAVQPLVGLRDSQAH